MELLACWLATYSYRSLQSDSSILWGGETVASEERLFLQSHSFSHATQSAVCFSVHGEYRVERVVWVVVNVRDLKERQDLLCDFPEN